MLSKLSSMKRAATVVPPSFQHKHPSLHPPPLCSSANKRVPQSGTSNDDAIAKKKQRTHDERKETKNQKERRRKARKGYEKQINNLNVSSPFEQQETLIYSPSNRGVIKVTQMTNFGIVKNTSTPGIQARQFRGAIVKCGDDYVSVPEEHFVKERRKGWVGIRPITIVTGIININGANMVIGRSEGFLQEYEPFHTNDIQYLHFDLKERESKEPVRFDPSSSDNNDRALQKALSIDSKKLLPKKKEPTKNEASSYLSTLNTVLDNIKEGEKLSPEQVIEKTNADHSKQQVKDAVERHFVENFVMCRQKFLEKNPSIDFDSEELTYDMKLTCFVLCGKSAEKAGKLKDYSTLNVELMLINRALLETSISRKISINQEIESQYLDSESEVPLLVQIASSYLSKYAYVEGGVYNKKHEQFRKLKEKICNEPGCSTKVKSEFWKLGVCFRHAPPDMKKCSVCSKTCAGHVCSECKSKKIIFFPSSVCKPKNIDKKATGEQVTTICKDCQQEIECPHKNFRRSSSKLCSKCQMKDSYDKLSKREEIYNMAVNMH